MKRTFDCFPIILIKEIHFLRTNLEFLKNKPASRFKEFAITHHSSKMSEIRLQAHQLPTYNNIKFRQILSFYNILAGPSTVFYG